MSLTLKDLRVIDNPGARGSYKASTTEASLADLVEVLKGLPQVVETTTDHYDKQEGPYTLDWVTGEPGRYLVWRLEDTPK